MEYCASCGVAEVDDIQLKDCDDCDLVKYCSDACQELHRPEHAGECKKRVAKLHDETLFKQPESTHLGDCPICCLPLPIESSKSTLNTCCSKMICEGCNVANQKREILGRLQQSCPFCRKGAAQTEEESNERLMKRVEANDPVAMREMGIKGYQKGDYNAAFDYFTRAAALGDVQAHYQLSALYYFGQGVEKDEKKQMHHLKEAAIGGHPGARHTLGRMEEGRLRMDRAAKHYIIATKLGYDKSLDRVKDLYKSLIIKKEDFAAALRGHHAAVKATKSAKREEAAVFLAELERRRV